MEQQKLDEIINLFRLKNDLTENFNIWVGHAKIGFRKSPTIEEAKKYFSDILMNL